MRSEPVLLETVDIKMWSRLDEIASIFHSGKEDKAISLLLSVVEDVSVTLNPIHSAVLVRILNMAAEENIDDIQSVATKVMEKCSLTDTYPALEVADIFISQGNLKLAKFIIERREIVSDKAFLEYVNGRILKKEGNSEEAEDHFLASYDADPSFLRTYDQMIKIDPTAGWNIKKNIALLRSGDEAEKAERSFSNTKIESLYRIYWEWYKGDKNAAKNMLTVSVNEDNITDFKLAAARVYTMDGDLETSVKFYKEVYEEFNSQYVSIEYADALTSSKRPSEALSILLSVEKKDPLNRNMMQFKMSALAALGMRAEVKDTVLSFMRTEHADRRGYEFCADILSGIGENDEAAKLIDVLISRFPGDPLLFVLRSSNELSAGRSASALEAADEAVKISARDPLCRYQRAKVFYKTAKIKKALRDIDAAITADPGYVPAYVLLKDIRMEQKDHRSVLELCEKILVIDPKNADVMKDKAYALGVTGNKDGSLNEYRNALRIKDDQPLFESILIRLMESQRYDELENLCNEFGETYVSSSMMWRLKGNSEYASENYQSAMESFGKAVDISPYEPQIWHSRGMVAEKLGQLKKAEESFDKALLLDLDSSEYWLSKAVIQERRGNLKGAVLALNRVISESPESVFALVKKALILVRFEKYDEAIFFIDLALKINRKDVAILNIKKDITKHTFRYESTIRVCDDILLADSKNKEAFDDKLKAQLALEQYSKAVLTADRALMEYPMSLDVLFMKKSALRSMEDHKGEVEICNQILSLDPGNRQVKMDLAESLSAIGETESAMSIYDQLQEEDPMDVKVVVMKSKIRSNMGEGSEAVALFQEVLENRPNDPETLNVLAEVMFREGFSDEALRVLDTAIKKDPSDVRSYKVKAQILINDKNYEEAQNVLKNALKVDLNDAQIWRSIAEVQEARRDMHQALLAYDSAMKMGMNDSEIYFSRGRVQEQLGMDEAAINSYSIVTIKDPTDARSLVRMAELQIKMNRLSTAAQNLDSALNIDRENPQALFARARVHISQGEIERAKVLYERFVESGSNDNIAEEFCELVGGDPMTIPSYRQAKADRTFMDDIEMYSHTILEYCYNTGYAIRDKETFQESGVPEGIVNDVLNYLGNIKEYGDIDTSSKEFLRLEQLSKNLILGERLTSIDSEPLVSLSSAYMASGAKNINEAKTLVAYIYKVMTEDVEQDAYPEDVVQISNKLSSSAGDVTVFGIMESFDAGLGYARMSKMLSAKMTESITFHI